MKLPKQGMTTRSKVIIPEILAPKNTYLIPKTVERKVDWICSRANMETAKKQDKEDDENDIKDADDEQR